MTVEEFVKMRKKLNLATQKAAALALGVTRQAVNHWETGRVQIPRHIEILLECLALNKRKKRRNP